MDKGLSSEVISSLIVAATTIGSLYIGHRLSHPTKQQKIKVIEKQFYSVYLPLFKEIEPFLYRESLPQEFIEEFLKSFNTIKDKHYELIECDLLNDMHIFENQHQRNKFSIETYNSICYSLEKHFERCRKKLSLPRRKFYYKLNNKQFKRETLELIEYFLKLLTYFLGILAFGLFLKLIIQCLTPIVENIRELFLK